MAKVRTPRERWLEAGFRALAEGGPDAVRVEVLAETLGVTKGGFYWHFAGRREFLDELLAAWERLAVDDAITHVEAEAPAADARGRLRELFALAASLEDLMPLELAIRDWGRREAEVGERVRRVDERRMEYMRSLFSQFVDDPAEVEARCLLVFSAYIGERFVQVQHPRQSRREVMATASRYLLS